MKIDGTTIPVSFDPGTLEGGWTLLILVITLLILSALLLRLCAPVKNQIPSTHEERKAALKRINAPSEHARPLQPAQSHITE